MKTDPWWRRYWRSLRSGPEVAEELELHLELIAQDLVAKGMSPDEARREAARRFGDRSQVQSQLETIERGRSRRLRFGIWLEELLADLRYGARGLLRKPSYALAAALSLSIGIGAATTVFTIVDAWLFRPLPVDRPERLVLIGATYPSVGDITIPNISIPTVRELADRKDLFEDAAAWRFQVLSLRPSTADRGSLGYLLTITGNYFGLLGVKAVIGRMLSEADARERAAVVVLDYAAWRTKFGGDSSIVGRAVMVAGVPFTVIGVAEPRFRGTEHLLAIDGYITTGSESTLDPRLAAIETDRTLGFYQVIARRRPGVSLDAIRSALAVQSAQLTSAYPTLPQGYQLKAYAEEKARPSISAGGRTEAAGYALLGLGALILAAAAVNVTNLILTRASARQEEVAVRLALGASRWRVVRQLLTESALLGILGFAGAWAFAQLATDAIAGLAKASTLALRLAFTVDGRVLAVSFLAAIGAGLVSGVGPALVASRGVQGTLRRAGRSGLGGLGGRFRSGLVVAQVAASFLVLVAAGLFVEGVRKVGALELGMNPDRVLSGVFQVVQARTNEPPARTFERIAAALRERPGVEAVSIATSVPLTSGGAFIDVYPDDPPPNATANGSVAAMGAGVDPEYFTVMGIRLLSGRAFTIRDDSLAPSVAIINEEAARVWWPGADPIGRQLRLVPGGPPVQIVGVVPTGRYLLITESPRPFLMTPLAQTPLSIGAVLVKTRLDPLRAEDALRDAAASVDPDLVPFSLATMENTIRNGVNGMLPIRFGSMLTAAIGVLALVLTVVGLYGVLAFSVSQETREIGVRMALGADRGAIVRRVLGRGGRLLGWGVAIGAVAALLGTRVLVNLLPGVSTTDVRIYAAVALLLVTITAVAAYLPARRAARLDPVSALRM